jgi:membrane peptidoglycan carboxypeptidase
MALPLTTLTATGLKIYTTIDATMQQYAEEAQKNICVNCRHSLMRTGAAQPL